jgi:cysteine desulfurase
LRRTGTFLTVRRIYADHAATTPLLPEVAEAMRPWVTTEFGNPSALYQEGRKARLAIDEAREIISGALGCSFGEVILTGSGTEAANLAVIGAALAHTGSRRRILYSAAEHHCVTELGDVLNRIGFSFEPIAVGPDARVDLEDLSAKLSPDVLLVSVMHANNETGSLNPIEEVSDRCREAGALLFADAVQTFGAMEVDVESLGVDLLSSSSHKLGGPKGAGALYIRAGTPLKPLIYGGGQEREMRAGTESVANICGFGKGVELRHEALRTKPIHSPKIARDAFVEAVEAEALGALWLSRKDEACLPGHALLRIPGVSAESLLVRLDRMGVSASSGAACSSGSIEPSHVALAIGLSEAEAKEVVRFTFGWGQPGAEGIEAAHRLAEAVRTIRER